MTRTNTKCDLNFKKYIYKHSYYEFELVNNVKYHIVICHETLSFKTKNITQNNQ